MINLIVNGNSYSYPQPGDKANTGWGSQATNWASAVTAALTALGLGGTLTPTPNAVIDINSTTKGILVPRLTTTQRNAIISPATSLLIFNTTLGVFQYYTGSAWITVGAKIPDNVQFDGTLTVNGNISTNGSVTAAGALSGATGNFTDTTDATNADNAPLKTLGGMAVKKKLFVGTDFNVGGNANITGNATVDGVIYADDNTTANTPVISFTGDTNTGIGHSAADTLDYVTGGVPRARLNSTGQQSSVVPDLSGSNTNLYNEYKCRAWVNFDGTTTSPTIRGSGNITSVTKNATGDFTISFFTDMPDVNYSVNITVGDTSSPNPNRNGTIKSALSVGSFTIVTGVPSTGSTANMQFVCCTVFR